MRFFRYTTPANHSVYTPFSAEEARVLRHFDDASVIVNQQYIVSAADVFGKWIIFRAERFDTSGFILFESVGGLILNGETPVPIHPQTNFHRFAVSEPGLYALRVSELRNITIQAVGAHLSGLAVLDEIGSLSEFPATTGSVRNAPAVYKSLTQKSYVSDYDRALRLQINLTGAPKEDADLLAGLTDLERFWVWASGGGIGGDASWAARDIFVPMVAGDWSGWNGDKGTAIHGAHGRIELLETGRYFTPEDYSGAVDESGRVVRISKTSAALVSSLIAVDTIPDEAENREAVFDIELQAGDRLVIAVQEDGIMRSDGLRRATINGYNATDLFVWTGRVFAANPVAADGKLQLRVLA